MQDQMIRSNCPICGRSYPHKEGYKPVTCGRLECLQEANRRIRQKEGLKQGEEILVRGKVLLAEGRRVLDGDAEIADNMKDVWSHQQSEAEL